MKSFDPASRGSKLLSNQTVNGLSLLPHARIMLVNCVHFHSTCVVNGKPNSNSNSVAAELHAKTKHVICKIADYGFPNSLPSFIASTENMGLPRLP
jgi:hypothetical protein